MTTPVALYLQDAHTIHQGIELVRYAESQGFHSVWQADSRLVRDAVVPMAAFAASTETIKIGSGVIDIWTRNPARLASTMGVRVHAIGVGTTGAAPVPVDDPVFGRRYVFQPVDIDEGALRTIATETGGRYFRATDARSLAAVFEQIDALETTEVRVRERVRRTELFGAPALAGGALILFEILMAALALRVDP